MNDYTLQKFEETEKPTYVVETSVTEKQKAMDVLDQQSYTRAAADAQDLSDTSAQEDLKQEYDERGKDRASDRRIKETRRDTDETRSKAENDAEYCNRYKATLERYHKTPDGLTKPQAAFWVMIDWVINVLVLICGGWLLIFLKKTFDLVSKLGKGVWISIGSIIGLALLVYVVSIAIKMYGMLGQL